MQRRCLFLVVLATATSDSSRSPAPKIFLGSKEAAESVNAAATSDLWRSQSAMEENETAPALAEPPAILMRRHRPRATSSWVPATPGHATSQAHVHRMRLHPRQRASPELFKSSKGILLAARKQAKAARRLAGDYAPRASRVFLKKIAAIRAVSAHLDAIVNESNETLNQMVDTVMKNTPVVENAVRELKAASKTAGQGSVNADIDDAATNFSGTVLADLHDFQDEILAVRDRVQHAIHTEVLYFTVLRESTLNGLSDALLQVAALRAQRILTSLLAVGGSLWPFNGLVRKDGGEFELAAEAILAANASVVTLAEFLHEVKTSSNQLVSDLMLGSVQSSVSELEDKCGAAVAVQGHSLRGALAEYADNVCNAPKAALAALSVINQNYSQQISTRIIDAEDSIQPLFECAAEFKKLVQGEGRAA